MNIYKEIKEIAKCNSKIERLAKKSIRKTLSECYCVDCWHLDKEKYVCRKHNIYVTDDSFCNNADPN